MDHNVEEYRYSEPVRRRAIMLAGASAIVFVVLLALLMEQWAIFSWPTRLLGIFLVITLLFTVRAQVLRALFRCRITPEGVEIVSPPTQRMIAWSDIAEVRRLAMRQVGGGQRWACAVYTRSHRGTMLPTYLFDDQLEDAEQALASVMRHTPHATHKDLHKT